MQICVISPVNPSCIEKMLILESAKSTNLSTSCFFFRTFHVYGCLGSYHLILLSLALTVTEGRKAKLVEFVSCTMIRVYVV